jgi:hypothetical protein
VTYRLRIKTDLRKWLFFIGLNTLAELEIGPVCFCQHLIKHLQAKNSAKGFASSDFGIGLKSGSFYTYRKAFPGYPFQLYP